VNRVSLRSKWWLVLVATFAGPMLLLAVVMTRIQRDGLFHAEQELEVAVVDEAARRVDFVFREAERATDRVGQLLTDARITDDDARLALAREAVGRARTLADVSVYDANGALLDTIKRDGARPAATPAPAQVSPSARASAVAWVAGVPGEVPQVCARLGDAADTRGWACGRLDAGVVEGDVAELSRNRFGAEGRVLVFDDHGKRIAWSRERGESNDDAEADGQALFRIAGVTPAAFGTGFAVTTAFVGARGVPYVASVRTLPERRWAIVVRRPEAEAFGALVAARNALLWASGVFVLASFVAAALVSARTTRPIAALVGLANAYARHELATPSPVKTGDELEHLGDAMARMASSLADGEAEVARRVKVEAAMSRYLPGEVAKAIARGEAKLDLGGARKPIAVLFADVAAFTPFAERAPAEDVVAFLNELFGVLSEIVFRHGGMVDKFMGDCIMAVFGTETAADHVRRAVAAAEDMHRFVETNADAWKERWGIDARLGIGVASGEALVGNLGSEARMEYTAIGDVVNVAARLETLARAGRTLATREVKDGAGDGFTFASLGEQPLRGKSKPVEIFELGT
jgi:adenylate cyclase